MRTSNSKCKAAARLVQRPLLPNGTLCVPFAHAYHIAEHAAAFGGKLGILMVAAKKPLVVGQLQQNFIQKAVQLVSLAAGKGGKIQNLLGASWVST